MSSLHASPNLKFQVTLDWHQIQHCMSNASLPVSNSDSNSDSGSGQARWSTVILVYRDVNPGVAGVITGMGCILDQCGTEGQEGECA